MRIAGPLEGILFTVPDPKSPFGILDCRLALALHDMTRVLRRFLISEVRVDNMYRPRARVSGKKKQSQHARGLAVDILSLKRADGAVLDVKEDWHGELGAAPCGPGSAIRQRDERAVMLRNLTCELARESLFHHVLTPNYDAAHRDHLHFDIQAGERSWMVE